MENHKSQRHVITFLNHTVQMSRYATFDFDNREFVAEVWENATLGARFKQLNLMDWYVIGVSRPQIDIIQKGILSLKGEGSFTKVKAIRK